MASNPDAGYEALIVAPEGGKQQQKTKWAVVATALAGATGLMIYSSRPGGGAVAAPFLDTGGGDVALATNEEGFQEYDEFEYLDQGLNHTTELSTSGNWLELINAHRAHHGACPLTWSSTIANDMLHYVNQQTTMVHSPDHYHLPPPHGPAGENLAQATPRITPEHAVSSWYNEYHHCHWPGCHQGGTGHFTAMIWKGAWQVGCAVADTPYGLAGCRFKGDDHTDCTTPNWGGCYDQNVGRLGDHAQGCHAGGAPSPPALPHGSCSFQGCGGCAAFCAGAGGHRCGSGSSGGQCTCHSGGTHCATHQ